MIQAFPKENARPRPVPRKVYTEKQPGIQPGGDSSGYTNLGTMAASPRFFTAEP